MLFISAQHHHPPADPPLSYLECQPQMPRELAPSVRQMRRRKLWVKARAFRAALGLSSPGSAKVQHQAEPSSRHSKFARLLSCKQILPGGVVAVMEKKCIRFQFCDVGRLLKALFSTHILIPFLPQLQIASAPKHEPFCSVWGWGVIFHCASFQMRQGQRDSFLSCLQTIPEGS